jgi:Fe-Mn family superoxide dismutase
MNFVLEPLPYADSALEPHIGRATLVLHHQKHHGGYLAKLEELIGGKPEAEESLESIILGSEGPVFDNAAQVWNHSFYWKSMKPDGGGEPKGRFADALLADFGSFRSFRSTFLDAGQAHFGSGWLWLVVYGGRLRVLTTPDADLPMVYRATALLCADLWEHAYYLDYHNERGKYLEAFFDHLADWDFAAVNWGNAEESRVRAKAGRSSGDYVLRAKSSHA